MGLGNNRDYKTSARSITKALQRHGNIMADLVQDGMNREEASHLARLMLKDKALFDRVYAERTRHRADMKEILGVSSYGHE